MSTANAVATALYSKLSGGTALGSLLSAGSAIYRNQAPDHTTRPYVVFSPYAGGPLNETPSDLRDEVYFVRGYADSGANAGSIDAAISALLHDGSLSVSGYTCYSVKREQDFELVEPLANGNNIFMAGGTYRICLDA